MSKAIEALRAELGAAARQLPELGTVPDDALDGFVAAVRKARDDQRALLAKSAEDSLRLVPALLRPAVRKVLFG